MNKPIIIQYKKDSSSIISIVAGTHGDEIVGIEVINKLRARIEKYQIKGNIQFIIANPLAVNLGLRFVYKNLNTETFPGNFKGSYEEKLAFQLVKILNKSDYVIDLHSTSNPIEPYVITRNLNKKTIEFAKMTNIKKMVYYSISKLPNKTLIDYGKCSIALEIGPHRSDLAFEIYTDAVLNTLINLKFIKGKSKKSKNIQMYEYLGGISELDKKGLSKIKNFSLIEKGSVLGRDYDNKYVIAHEDFVPFLKTERSSKFVFSYAKQPILV